MMEENSISLQGLSKC